MKAKAKAKRKVKAKERIGTPLEAREALARKLAFGDVVRKLETILRKYERGGLKPRRDVMGGFCLIGPATETSRGREVWFGAVGPRKSYVSYHLMPVYMFPDLLKKASPALKKRMQGKSCFNFKEVDEKLFAELAKLTDEGFKRFQAEKLVR